MRTTWDIPPRAFKDAHFAVYPIEIPLRAIRAGCPTRICKKCKQPRRKIYKKKFIPTRPGYLTGTGKSGSDIDPNQSLHQRDISKYRMQIDYQPIGYTDCGCNAGWEPGVVLDPFMGAGTTAVAAEKLGCRWIGIELNEEYCRIAAKRISEIEPMFNFEEE